jgi:hypothetical protein
VVALLESGATSSRKETSHRWPLWWRYRSGQAALQHAVRDTRGEQAVRYAWGQQHLTIGYARQVTSSDDAQRSPRRVRLRHAQLRIDAVHLVDVTADSEAKTITWRDLSAIPSPAATDAIARPCECGPFSRHRQTGDTAVRQRAADRARGSTAPPCRGHRTGGRSRRGSTRFGPDRRVLSSVLR